jgi:hypothetical protein
MYVRSNISMFGAGSNCRVARAGENQRDIIKFDSFRSLRLASLKNMRDVFQQLPEAT